MAIVGVSEAAEEIRRGGVGAMPTETVYGLAASISSRAGIEKIFTTKQRPFFDPLIVHVADIQQAKTLTTDWNAISQILAEKFWPGPLTMVLPKADLVSDLITSGLPTVGIRMPKHNLAIDLIQSVGFPLAAPSANKFGRTSPTEAKHVETEFSGAVKVIDGGACQVGLESTILGIKSRTNGDDAAHPARFVLTILRQGAITQAQIEKTLKQAQIQFVFEAAASKIEAPGQMKHHYMPNVPLVLVKETNLSDPELLSRINAEIKQLPAEVEGVKLVRPSHIASFKEVKLSEDAALAARCFYAELRSLSEAGAECLVFKLKPIHAAEEFAALMDRITKAASIKI